MSTLLDWLSAPRADRGVYLADSGAGWQRIPYDALAGASHRMAARLAAAGVRASDVVCFTAPTTYQSLVTIFGAWLAGATICPLPEPSFQPDAEYIDHIAKVLDRARPAVTITSEQFAMLLGKAVAQAGLPQGPMVLADHDADPPPPLVQPVPPAEIALLQFTSGSTGNPQGVRVSWDNLAANLAVQHRWIRWREGEGVASWLPLYHDMGLIGGLLFAVAMQTDLWLMRPDQFIRNPARWLECFASGSARHAPAPSFAFAYLARRVHAERFADLDLSRWRSAIVGAEVVDACALAAFARIAAPAGFSPATFLPAYGLAENTLAVTSPGSGEGILLVRPDWTALRLGEAVRVIEQARFGDGWAGRESGWLVGHGRPVPEDGIGIRIVDDRGTPVPAGHLGEIVVWGSSVTLGYHGPDPTRATRFMDGALHTGDAGFFYQGQLFVLGRMGDSLKVRGRSVYVEDLDAKLAEAAGLNRDRVVVVNSTREGRAGVVVFAEARPGPWIGKLTERLRGELGPEPGVTIVTGSRGMILRTSSGKPRRRQMWQLLNAGQLKGASVIDLSAESRKESRP